ncbi:MAG TPA: hypothetical protein VGM98_15175 [Schlesneria sp.]|jgi:hypothetical protein
MHPFVETVSIAGGTAAAIVSAIIILTLFYKGLAWLGGAAKPDTISIRGVLKKGTLATVYVAGKKIFERVRFIGFTNTETMKTHLPHELNGMVILEDEAKVRYLVRARDIHMVVVPPEGERVAAIGSN